MKPSISLCEQCLQVVQICLRCWNAMEYLLCSSRRPEMQDSEGTSSRHVVNGNLAVSVKASWGVCFLYVTAAAPRRPGFTGAAKTIHVDDEFNGTKYVQRHVGKVQEGAQKGSGRIRTYISGVEVV
jgi:hypothetical protein